MVCVASRDAPNEHLNREGYLLQNAVFGGLGNQVILIIIAHIFHDDSAMFIH